MNPYKNPAKQFIKYQNIESLEDVILYADFLRIEAGISSNPPINLQPIFDHFGIPYPEPARLTQQQALILNFPKGIPQIIYKDDDISFRQNFSIAHELIETLFLELPGDFRFDGKKRNTFGIKGKEIICQKAAASLLMPQESFAPKMQYLDLSLASAKLLADEFRVSKLAALFRFVDLYSKNGVVILWKSMNKPSEIGNQIPESQMVFEDFDFSRLLTKKLRVEWSFGKFHNIHIPRYKSALNDSAVYKTWRENSYSKVIERIPFGKYNIFANFENQPMFINNQLQVLSLISDIN